MTSAQIRHRDIIEHFKFHALLTWISSGLNIFEISVFLEKGGISVKISLRVNPGDLSFSLKKIWAGNFF